MSIMALHTRFTCRSLHCLLRKHNNFRSLRPQVRTILSEAYLCRDEWKKRLQTPTLQKINAEDFALRLQEKFDRDGSIAPVDMDIFANKFELLPAIQLDFAQSLIYKFRHTKASVQVTDSTHHAIIRTLLDLKEYSRLQEILKDKIHYGVFLDHITANILLDHFIKEKKYLEAAEVAFDLMLQEDFSHPICRALSWYACHLLWKNPEAMVTAEVEPESPEKAQEDDDDEEDVYIPVPFLENYWYDDHFDIPTIPKCLGKTLTMVTAERDDVLGRNYRLIGLGLYQKFDKGIDLLKTCAGTDGENVISEEALEDFNSRLENLETKEPPSEAKDPGIMTIEDEYPFVTEQEKNAYLEQFKAVSDRLRNSGKVTSTLNLQEELLSVVRYAVRGLEKHDINESVRLYEAWNEEREALVKQQIQDYKDAQLHEEIEERLRELKETEERLTFYDLKNQNKIFAKKQLGKKKQEIDDLFETEEMQHWAPKM